MIYGFCVCAPVQTFFPVPFHPFFPASLPLSFSRYCHVLKSCWLHVPAYSFGRFHSPRAGLYSLCIKPVCVFHRLWLSYVVLHFQLAAKHFRALVTGFPFPLQGKWFEFSRSQAVVCFAAFASSSKFSFHSMFPSTFLFVFN